MYDYTATGDLQFSKSADANKGVILEQLRNALQPLARVLEIASGTGQHAVYFASSLPGVTWQPSDVDLDAMDLQRRLDAEAPENVLPLVALNIAHWPTLRPKYDAVFSANCLHIIPNSLVAPYVAGAAKSLKPGGQMLLYGPFKYGGAFTTPSNAQFNGFLENTYSGGGIRDFEAIDGLANENGMTFVSDTPMPANNQFLVWRKA